nr:MAG TPA: protein of unknown function (DUF3850) [Caudoviricetes sp.]
MLTFNLKKEWFEKIKSGEKTHEYREKTNYWHKRLFTFWDKTRYNKPFGDNDTICFACGYPKANDLDKRLFAKIKSVTITHGKYTDLKINEPVFDIEFELIKEQI